MLNLYDKNGYLNIGAVLSLGCPFNFIWGGRGTGKTYGSLKYALDNNIKIMYTRTSQVQADLIRTPEFFPYKKINADTNGDVIVLPVNKNQSAFYHGKDDDKGKLVATSDAIGYSCALSTIANLRGFDASDVKLWIYDEFVPEKSERGLGDKQAYAFFNGYETMNRNREMNGEDPLKVLCLSNSESADCDIFMRLGLVTKVADMTRRRQSVSVLRDRGIALINLWDSPISKRKSEDVLYNMVGKNSDFYRMSIENDFYSLDYRDVSSLPISEFKIVTHVGEIYIYEHKSNDTLYVSENQHGTPETTFGTDTRSLAAFRREYAWCWEYYMDYTITFETIECKILFEKYFKST